MSSTNRKQREGTDTYYTPSWCVHRVIEATPQLPGGVWIDAGAGNGEILKAVNQVRQDIVWAAVELREECGPALEKAATISLIGDFPRLTRPQLLSLLRQVSHKPRFDVLIMNPPFQLAFAFLQQALLIADHVVMLQRLNYLGSRNRSSFFRQFPPDIYVLPNRPIFQGKGGDSVEYAWMVWGPEGTRARPKGFIEILPETPIETRGKKRTKRAPVTVEGRLAEQTKALPEVATGESARLAEMEQSADEEHRETPGHGEESL